MASLRTEWTEDDYYLASERNQLVELSEGNLLILPVPTEDHQLLSSRVYLPLHAYVSAHRLGRVRFAPLPVRLWPGKIREPDVMYMSEAHLDRIGKYWGVPDLAVEIVSEGGEAHDKRIKRHEYAQAGIAEYWIVDPEPKAVEFLTLNETERTYASSLLSTGDSLVSRVVPGFTLAIAELFAPE